MPKLKELIAEAAAEMPDSPSAVLDAHVLAQAAFNVTRDQVLIGDKEISDEIAIQRFFALVTERTKRVPVAYLVGEKEFWGLSFEVSRDVLIPRPETELVVELAVQAAKKKGGQVKVADLGTGSGCIAIAVATELGRLGLGCAVVAVEKCEVAAAIAQRNIERHGVGNLVTIRVSDWFTSLGRERFDIIVTNPPYVAVGEECSPETAYEPASALFAEDGGLSDVIRILEELPSHLEPGGEFICEFGCGKRDRLRSIIERSYPAWTYEFLGDMTVNTGFTVVRCRLKEASDGSGANKG